MNNISEVLKRLTGISTPIGGISWNPPTDERKVAEEVVTFCESKRSLHPTLSRRNVLKAQYTRESISDSRDKFIDFAEKVNRESELHAILSAMIIASNHCLEELDEYVPIGESIPELIVSPNEDPIAIMPGISEILSEYRFKIWTCIFSISAKYKISLSDDYIKLLPIITNNNAK